jgi:hypothetical protein
LFCRSFTSHPWGNSYETRNPFKFKWSSFSFFSMHRAYMYTGKDFSISLFKEWLYFLSRLYDIPGNLVWGSLLVIIQFTRYDPRSGFSRIIKMRKRFKTRLYRRTYSEIRVIPYNSILTDCRSLVAVLSLRSWVRAPLVPAASNLTRLK